MIYQEKMQQNEKPNEQMLSCFVYRNYKPDFAYHWHTYFEVIYIIKNTTILTVNGVSKACVPGELVFIPAMTLHALSSANEELSDNLVLQFNKVMLEQGLSELIQISNIEPGNRLKDAIAYEVTKDGELEKVIRQLQKLCEQNPNGSALDSINSVDGSVEIAQLLRVKGLVLSMLSYMIEEELIVCAQKGESTFELSDLYKLESVLRYMSEHVEEKLGMEVAAKMAGMSYHSFSRAFHQISGMNYKEYQNKLSIWRAEELLAQTDQSILDIAQLVQFSNLSYFNSIFKKYSGVTPSEYRKKYKNEKR